MNLHEYQSKSLFARFGIPIPRGRVATSPQDAYDIAKEFGCPVVVKAQVLASGRGAAGGIRLARTPEQTYETAEAILGMEISALDVHKVLVDPCADILREMYLSVMYDRTRRKPIIVAWANGKTDTAHVVHEAIDPFLGLRDYQTRNLALGIELPREYWRRFTEIAHGLYQCFHDCDATLCEIDPLALTQADGLIALDGKIVIDDNALFRHPELAEMRDLQAEPGEETRAREAGLHYLKFEGDIGCMVNGAGLAMTTLDALRDIAGRLGWPAHGPANFLDVGAARGEKVAVALRLILQEPRISAVLVNIFGGITRCDEVARGVVQAMSERHHETPVVVRLAGTNAEEGRQIIDHARLPMVQSAGSLLDAAEKAVRAANKRSASRGNSGG